VSLWDRLTRKSQAPPATAEAVETRAEASDGESHEVARLRRVGEEGGPGTGEALALFRALRATHHEARAIDAIRTAARTRVVDESLVVAAAAALVDRGETDHALALVDSPTSRCSSLEARMLAADLRESRGELTLALALVERVMVRNLDYPGARERHRRWRAELGLDANHGAQGDPNASTIVSRETDAPFLLLREVARGGAGAVYEAEDRDLGRRVALKVYHHVDRDRAQLLHEARVGAALAGAGVVRVLDVDPDHGWLALEWAAGGSLRQRLRGDDLVDVAVLARWAPVLAETIARVHANGWVHHDIKPANVLLGADARPLLADFGTARRTGEPSPPGSLGYVSPERLAARPSDPRDDVFGFGRILEDALDALGNPPDAAAWRALATACTGPDATRPADGAALMTRLRVEAPTA
jgi:serine/threonine-protein kinase